MSNRPQSTVYKLPNSYFKLKPLVACMRVAITGSLFAGVVAPSIAHADSPLPIPVPGAGWVSSGSAAMNVTGNTMRIDQKSDKAILNWKEFNVGKDNTVQFVQPGSSSIALNRIFQESPSKILGHITANGQIYLVNKNGFVFDKDSVVNTGALVASALNISEDAFNKGIIRTFDQNRGQQNLDQAALNGADGDQAVNPIAAIDVKPGAKIQVGKNGNIILAAPTVTNEGAISAEEGSQILLVASKDKVYLQPTTSDSPFAGLLVEVGTGGKVTNAASGEISARQGNITLAGFAVNQEGRIKATTSVNVNGSVRLLAREKAQDVLENGTFKLKGTKTDRTTDLGDGLKTESEVRFGENSSVEIAADANGGSAFDEQEQKKSYIEVSANKIHMEANSSIVSPSGKVNFTATNNLLNPIEGTKGRIAMENGARIDVSGTKNVEVAMERNVAEVSVQSFNLRDAPFQRGGVLQGETVKVDIRKGTKILDASGGSVINKGIDERLVNGGEINFTSSGDLIVNSGAVTDISGGSVRFKDGYINTTKLLSSTGRIVDISDADPNEKYVSIFGVIEEAHEKWGATRLWNNSLSLGRFENGYVEGKAGGKLNIQSPLTSWNGLIIAGSVSGPYQRSNPADGGAFSINSLDNATNRTGLFLSKQNILFETQQAILDIAFKDPFPKNSNNQSSDLILSTASISQSGLSSISIKTAGNVTVPNNVALSMPALGTFSVDSSNINIAGSIYAAGGTVALNSVNTGLIDTGKINLSASSILDVSGRWVNDFNNGLTTSLSESVIIQGGNVSLKANNELNFNNGAVIKADGGAWLSSDGVEITAGKAGDIKLTADAVTNTLIPGVLRLSGQVSAYGLNEGGHLTLSSNKINVGTDVNEANVLNIGVNNKNFDFAPSFGFRSVSLKSNLGDIAIKSDTNLSLMAQNRILIGNYRNQASSKSIGAFSQLTVLPEHLRKPVTLTFDGRTGVRMEAGSSIHADKESTINISTGNEGKGIYIDGVIDAPAGSINLALNTSSPSVAYDPSQSIWVGSHAVLTTHGATRLNPIDVFNRTSGDVLDGGNLTANAERGYIVFEEGSKIDVSGTSAQLDLPSTFTSGSGVIYTKQSVGSNAGKISLTAAEGIVLDGALLANAGSSSNHGGRLDLVLDRNQRDEQGAVFPTNTLHVDLMQHDQRFLPANVWFGSVISNSLNGTATLSGDEFAQAGFDDLNLVLPFQINTPDTAGEVRFVSDLNFTAASSVNIDAQTIKWVGLNGSSTGAANLNTAYLQLGSSTQADVVGVSATGGGRLTANALWTQLRGASLLTDFNQVNLNSSHDMRAVGYRLLASEQRSYNGNLSTAADLNLSASQIYPTTLSNYTISVTRPDGKLTVSGRNADTTPLSAAGKLVFNAPVIEQNGVLKAPLGIIELNASSKLSFGKDSLTSVSADDKTVPLGVIASNVWQYPLENIVNLVFNESPGNLTVGEKHLVFKSPSVEFNSGSVIDVSGGGDLLAYEFQPGLGGSFDYLSESSPSYQGGFAILPSLESSLAPYDHFIGANFKYDPREKIFLSGTGSLAAGDYTILPARYALLPGAYLVTPQAHSDDQIITSYAASELPIVSGYKALAGTNTRDARSSGFMIETSEQVKKQSEYNIQTANSFFAAQAARKGTSVPLLPVDSGQVSIQASAKLILDGQFNVDTKTGKGAKLDIAAQQIKVVNKLSPSGGTGVLEILDQNLSNLRVDSLLLGGSRTFNNITGSTDLTVAADDVVFDQGAHVEALDLIAAGKNSVQVKNGAVINARGNVSTGDSQINVAGDSALLRVSADKQITLNRSASPGLTGNLLVAEGATLGASKSMLLDASKSSILDGDINMQGGALSLTANSINLGEITGSIDGSLNLTNQKLVNLSVDDLVLTSRGAINFYGNVGKTTANGVSEPIKFNRLVLDAAGLSGFDNNGKGAKLQAESLLLQNSRGVSARQSGTGTGSLDLIADNYAQGAGDVGINGFGVVNINVNGLFTGVGDSVVNVASDLNLTAGLIAMQDGHRLKIDAGSSVAGIGHNVVIGGNPNFNQAIVGDFGGSVSVIANSILMNNANLSLPSGSFNIQAEAGNILVDGKTNIDLAGRAVNFADKLEYTPGGSFSAEAKHGGITLAENTYIDISAGGGGATGGELTLKTPNGVVEPLGRIKAIRSSANLDVSGFSSAASFDNLVSKLMAAGISESLYFRARNADIVQNAGNEIKANTLTLVSDTGGINLAGKLNANGSVDGGAVNLYAGGKITLKNGALLTATGTANGGKVMLSSVDSLVQNLSGIEIESGSTIDVSGANAINGGEVTLSALRTNNGINIKPISGTITGYRRFYAEGVRKYGNQELGNDGNIDSSDINQINSDTASYMSLTSQNVDGVLASGIHLRPGILINYAGDLNFEPGSAWDFSAQRFGQLADIPGALTMAASGKLNVRNSITDGFENDVLMTGESWSFQLVAGADLSSADKFATLTRTHAEQVLNAEAKNLTLGNVLQNQNGNPIKDAQGNPIYLPVEISVHTGSGDIRLAAGGDFVLPIQTSTVYTAGRADQVNRYGTLDGVQTLDYSLPAEPFTTAEKLAGEYPINGGDLLIMAGGNIKGATSSQFISGTSDYSVSPWLIRQGNYSKDNYADGNHLTAWAIDAAKFQQNIGSFGGGKVEIEASGNIDDLSVMMPTTGKQQGLDFNHNAVEINGGGDMQIKAGGDIAGGVYFLGKGEANLFAKGEIKGSTKNTYDQFAFTKGPQIILSGDQSDPVSGHSSMTLTANQSIKVAGVSDAMVLNPNASEFFSYTDKTAIALKSLAGDVNLNSDTAVLSSILNITNNFNQQLVAVYPATLEVTAFSGSVKFDDNIILYPSAVSNLTILANQDISSSPGAGSPFAVIMSDADPALLPKAGSPMFADFSDDNLRLSGLKFDPVNVISGISTVRDLIHAAKPVHDGDGQYARVVTKTGDISDVLINLPKQTIVQAGRDFKNASLQIQHNNPDDASVISAGRDLIFETGLTSDGLLDRTKAINKIEVAGPGDVLIKTGRDMDLGSAVGVSTVGNFFNTALPSQGASLDVIVGLNSGDPDYAAFIDKYQANPLYSEKFGQAKAAITEFIQQRSGNPALSEADAMGVFKSLSGDETLPVQSQLNAILTEVFFNELKIAGTASATDKAIGNESGFLAIDTLFPGNQWKGDLSLLFSKLHTISGGDINLFVPGGRVNAGLAVAPTGAGSKKVDELGIVAQRQGKINAFVKDDFNVNTSRIFTLGGGDILIWASDGDIDAGKGAKSALSVTVDPPFFDENDQLVVPAPKITNGSGIRTASSGQSSGDASSRRKRLHADLTSFDPGDVYLIAPRGVVNAGEAGIAGSNVTISATAVLGANNIQVGGISTGVPVASTGSMAAGLTGTSNLSAGVSQMAESSVNTNVGKDAGNALSKAVMGILSIEVLGFGE